MISIPHDTIAFDLLRTFGTGHVLERITDRYPGFSLDDGYIVAQLIRDLRVRRGERVVGRKFGGTNPATYPLTGATGPSWNFMYNTTVRELADGNGEFAIGDFRQPRIEPELVIRLRTTPDAAMDELELLNCIDSVAMGFEFVHSPYSDWRVRPPDAAAAFGLHQAALIGPWKDIAPERFEWLHRLKACEVTLTNNRGDIRRGSGANVLGSPVLALKAILADMANHSEWTAISAGEIVTTGTITELMPISPGQVWSSEIQRAPIAGLRVSII